MLRKRKERTSSSSSSIWKHCTVSIHNLCTLAPCYGELWALLVYLTCASHIPSPSAAFENEGTGVHVRVEFPHVRAICDHDKDKGVVPDRIAQPCACVILPLPR